MRIKIIVFVAILLLCNIVYAQVKEENFKKAVDYLNCKTVELSLKDDNNKDNYENYLKEVRCNENVSSDTIGQYLAKIKIKKTIELSEEIKNLKGAFDPNWSINQAASFLSQDVFDNGKYKDLTDFANKRKEEPDAANIRKDKPDFADFKTKLNEELKAKLSAEQITSGSSGETVIPNGEPKKPNTETEGFNFADWLPMIGFLLLAAGLIGSTSYLSLQLGNIKNDLRVLQNKFASFERKSNIPPTTLVKTSTTSNSSEINELKDAINELISRVGSLETNTTKKDNTNPEAVTMGWQDQQPKTEPMREVFYLSTPNEDGSFNDKSAHSSYKEGASMYKFTKISYNQAEFQLDERETSFKLAFEYPDKNIDPVCDAQNAFNPKAGRIVTVQGGSGKAELIGDKWKVTSKAKIRYEH